MLSSFITTYSAVQVRLQNLTKSVLTLLLTRMSFIHRYYRLNDLMWQDGLLIDFLQKKVTDKWVRRFLICSSYLFSERVLFKFTVRFYIDSVIWPFTTYLPFEFNNVASLLSSILVAILTLCLLFNLNYLYVLMF
jgi:hypothetical protein